MLVPGVQRLSRCLSLPVPSEDRGAEGADEGPEATGLLAGDGTMGRLRGELRPPVRGVGVLADLLPDLQEPHPAQTHHEHRSVTIYFFCRFSIMGSIFTQVFRVLILQVT